MDGNSAAQFEVKRPILPVNRPGFPKKFFFLVVIILGISLLFLFLIKFKIIDTSKLYPIPLKQVSIYQKQIDQLDSIQASVNKLPGSFNPRIDKERSDQIKKGVEGWIQPIIESLQKEDVETARELISKQLKSNIMGFDDPLQAKFVPEDLKKQHDPKDKYIQKDRVDPRILEIYLQITDILVATDKSY